MRDSRQITALRSLFRTLHPLLKSSIETGLAPARRMLTGSQPSSKKTADLKKTADESLAPARAAMHEDSTPQNPNNTPNSSAKATTQEAKKLPPLPRTLTDQHLVAELDNVNRQFELTGQTGRAGGESKKQRSKPQRGNRHLSRDTLLSLLEEAKVRIQVLETELELARGTEEHIPMLTEEWSDDQPSSHSRKLD